MIRYFHHTAWSLMLLICCTTAAFAASTRPTIHEVPRSTVSCQEQGHGRHHEAWYFGFSMGGATLWTENTPSFTKTGPMGLGFSMEVGLVARPWLLIGLDVSVVSLENGRAASTFSVVTAIYPFESMGIHLIGGVGAYMLMVPDPFEEGDYLDAGTGATTLAGVAYDLPIRDSAMVVRFALRGESSWGNHGQRAFGSSLRVGLSWF